MIRTTPIGESIQVASERILGKNYIGGEWTSGKGNLMMVCDPSTKSIFGSIPTATQTEMNKAVDAANEALKIWGDNSKWSWVRRAEVIDELVQLVKAHQEDIATLMSIECGKHLNESRADVMEGIHMLQYCAGMGRHPIGYKIPSEIPEKESETYRTPRGVCTVITPWNFPFAIPTWLIGPALVCGNTVIFKPSEETPLTGQFLVWLFDKAVKKYNVGKSGNDRVPPGVLNLVHGTGEVGEYLVRHEGTVGQLFTGSNSVGSKIKLIAAQHHEKFAICEMGGKNSLIVLEDADLNLAVNAAILSCYKTTHQRCVSSDNIIVQEGVMPQFMKMFLELTNQMQFGDPFDTNAFAGPLINQRAVEKFNAHAAIAEGECNDILRRYRADPNSNFVRPNVFYMKYRPNTFALRQEAFTPNINLVPVKDLDEALQVANDNDGCLSMALHTQDYRKIREFKTRAKGGMLYVNLPGIGAEIQLPFMGVKGSGTGMPSAAFLFNHLCHEIAVTINYGHEIKMAQGLSAKIG